MTNPYAKIARQSEGTWALFHKRVSSMQFDYSELFPEEVYSFLDNMAKSIGSSIGYLLPSILTSTAFALGSQGAQLMVGTHIQPINLFTIFIGHPGTGKSPAIEKIINPLRENPEIGTEILISRSTSSGLVKLLAKHGKAFVCSPEIYDFLIKLLKNDDETASGDIQLLCKLFSGEPATYHFATESARDIEQNTPFCLLGATQLQNAAKIVYRMDQGHGLLDRFLVAIPLALRPTPEQLDDAQIRLDEMAFSDFQPLFDAIFVAHTNIIRVYKLDDPCVTIHRDLQRDFAAEVNEEILHGNMPPKSKKTEIIPRVAVCLSVLSHFICQNLHPDIPHTEVPESVTPQFYRAAVKLVEHMESQKEMFVDFLKSITEVTRETVKPQPLATDIKTAIVLFPGPLVTYQAFKKYGARAMRSVARPEFETCAANLAQYGDYVKVRVPRSAKQVGVLVKKMPSTWPSQALCTEEEFEDKKNQPLNVLITRNILQALNSAGHYTEDETD